MDFIDWSQVNWAAVAALSVMVLVAAFIGNFINILFSGNPITGAILTALVFAILFIGWIYYPHGLDVVEMFGIQVAPITTQ
jgi:uncharacterized protein YqhQ